jgi:hypothetical protein
MQPTAGELQAASNLFWAAAVTLVGCVVAVAAACVKIARIRMDHEFALRATEEGADLSPLIEHQRRQTLGAYLAWGAALLALGVGFILGDFLVVREAIRGRPEEGWYLLGLGWDYALPLAGAALLIVYFVLQRKERPCFSRSEAAPGETAPSS